jgi:outer membrane lipase/esterase
MYSSHRPAGFQRQFIQESLMPRTKHLVSALALALAGMSTAQAQEFSAVISFGDSLSDAGQYAALPPPYYFGAQGSFTTNPDDVWTQVLASSFGLSQTASLAGGTDYAWGGAPTSFAVQTVPFPLQCVPATLPCKSVAQQIGGYLASTGGVADPNALYTYWAGANDIFNYLGAVQANPAFAPYVQSWVGASALTAVGEIAALQNAGATHIVVLNLPDIGVTPAFNGTPAQSSVSGLVFVYNTTLNGGLATLKDGIIPINAYQLIGEVMADPGLYGFSNVTGTACSPAGPGGGSSLFCTPASYVTPNANETYLFADGVHPSGAAHSMLASVVQATIIAPSQVSFAGEVPLAVYDSQSNFLNNQIFGMSLAPRGKGDSYVYGRAQYSRNDFDPDGNTHGFQSNLAFLSLGADVGWTDNINVGGSISYGGTRGDGYHSKIDADEVLASAFAVMHGEHAYLDLILSAGSSNFDIDRLIPIGAANRHETGNTSASHFGAELGGGWNFGGETFRHGPFATVAWQKVRVHDFAEDSLDSTAMWFDGFDRESLIGRLGWQFEGDLGSLHPFGRVAWAQENDTDPVAVMAGSNTMNGHFTFLGFTPNKDWAEGELGLGWAMNDHTNLNVSYRARINDDNHDFDALALDFRMEFGAAPAPAPEPVAEPVVEKTCADLDDDGDGITNCDDKCPASEAGVPVGPDGCPVPVEEPAPKPFRG